MSTIIIERWLWYIKNTPLRSLLPELGLWLRLLLGPSCYASTVRWEFISYTKNTNDFQTYIPMLRLPNHHPNNHNKKRTHVQKSNQSLSEFLYTKSGAAQKAAPDSFFILFSADAQRHPFSKKISRYLHRSYPQW